MTKLFQLPDGSVTKDADKYIDEWRELGSLVSEAFGEGAHVYSFDPGILIAVGDQTISLTLTAAKAIAQLGVENKKLRAALLDYFRWGDHIRQRAIDGDVDDMIEWNRTGDAIPQFCKTLAYHKIDPAELSDDGEEDR